MPVPLIWLGAVAIGAYTANKANNKHLKRSRIVLALPGESAVQTVPTNGSIVCCGIYGLLDHTGIWVDGNIYELAGNGLVRCVSPSRFLGNRSGDTIYVAADINDNPLFDALAAKRSQALLFQLVDYHLFKENCHKFVAQILAQERLDVTSFSDLNSFLSQFFNTTIKWNLIKINKV